MPFGPRPALPFVDNVSIKDDGDASRRHDVCLVLPRPNYAANCFGKSWELVAQAWVASVAIGPAILMWYHALNHRWATARRLFIISLAVYTACAVLLIIASD